MWILFLILLSGIAQADVYVVTAPDKSVYSISEQNDAVIPSGYSSSVIKNKQIKDLTVTMGDEKLYDFNGSKFTLNTAKVNAKNKAEADAIAAENKKNTDKNSAITKLKTLGLNDDEINAILK